jgi:hypothetical protein
MDKSGLTHLYDGPIYYNHMSNGWVAASAEVNRHPLGLSPSGASDFSYKHSYQLRPDLDEAVKARVLGAINSTPTRMTSFGQQHGSVQALPQQMPWGPVSQQVGFMQPDLVVGAPDPTRVPVAPAAPQPMQRPVIPLEMPNPHSLVPQQINAAVKEQAAAQLKAITDGMQLISLRVDELRRLLEA